MKMLTKLISAACLAGALAATSVAPAQAQSFGFSFGVGSPGYGSYWNDGPRYWGHGPRWGGPRWRGGNHWRYRNGPRAGFSINVNPGPRYGSAHIRRCEARYRSYDWRTDTFLGYDGKRHRCRL